MKPNRTRLLYDEIGGQYLTNRSFALNDHVEMPVVMSLMPDVKGKRVLDAGCGPGKHSRQLIKKGARVTAIDISAKMVSAAREYCGRRKINLDPRISMRDVIGGFICVLRSLQVVANAQSGLVVPPAR